MYAFLIGTNDAELFRPQGQGAYRMQTGVLALLFTHWVTLSKFLNAQYLYSSFIRGGFMRYVTRAFCVPGIVPGTKDADKILTLIKLI